MTQMESINDNRKLEDLKWKEFKLEDIFNISSGKRLTKSRMKNGNLPFIGATDSTNGVTSFVSNTNTSLDSNVLGVNYNGSVVENFYHPYKCLFSDDVKRLSFKDRVGNKYLYLFFKTIILQQKEKYRYGYKFNETRMKRQSILVPIDENGEPDWDFMEHYMIKLEDEVRPALSFEPHIIKDNRALKDLKWNAFEIEQIANVEGGQDIYSTERVTGSVPYITSTAQTNGIGYFVGNKNPSLEKDCISVNRNGSVGFSFYHSYHALYGNDIRKVRLKYGLHTSKYISLFITTTIMQQKEKYSYSVKMGTKRLKRQKVLLPIKDDETPDWDFMDQYMKRMENEIMSVANKKTSEGD